MSEVNSQSPELIVPNLNELDESIVALAADIRIFSQSQAKSWRQLPYLALQADGTSGYSSFMDKLYTYGLLHIVGQSVGLYGTFIDCENGNILHQNGALELDRFASDADVIEAWLPQGDRFNAQTWLEQYQAAAVKPYLGNGSRGEMELGEWRLETAQKLGLLSIFQRVQHDLES